LQGALLARMPRAPHVRVRSCGCSCLHFFAGVQRSSQVANGSQGEILTDGNSESSSIIFIRNWGPWSISQITGPAPSLQGSRQRQQVRARPQMLLTSLGVCSVPRVTSTARRALLCCLKFQPRLLKITGQAHLVNEVPRSGGCFLSNQGEFPGTMPVRTRNCHFIHFVCVKHWLYHRPWKAESQRRGRKHLAPQRKGVVRL
jgi:hypothetical protein